MRVRRNQVEYASTENPAVTSSEVLEAIVKARALVDNFVTVVIEKILT